MPLDSLFGRNLVVSGQLPDQVEVVYQFDPAIQESHLAAPGDSLKSAEFLSQILERESTFSPNALVGARSLRGIVLGAGSIGGATFLNLVRFGVASDGGLEVIDPETHELSNLPRQATDVLLLERLNINKAISTMIMGLRINPHHKCGARPYAVTVHNLDHLLKGQDFAIMGIDVSRPDLIVKLLQMCDSQNIPLFGGLDISTLRVVHTMLPGGQSLIRNALQPDRVRALLNGELHPLAWLALMVRVEYVPYQFFVDMKALVSGKIKWIPQSRIASEPQAIHTTANIINYFAGNVDRVPGFTAQDMIIDPYQPGDIVYEEEKQKKKAFATSSEPTNRAVMAMLGIDIDEYVFLLDNPRPRTINYRPC